MEAISGVASIFAVISLAVQVGECALRIKNGIATISNTSAELSRLRKQIEGLYGIANHVRVFLELSRRAGLCDEGIAVCVYSALTTCLDVASRIEDVLKKVNRVHNERSSLWRGWPHIRLLCNKEHIEELEKQMDRAVSMLNLTMTLHQASTQLCLNKGNTAAASISLENKVNLGDIAETNTMQENDDDRVQFLYTENRATGGREINFQTNDKFIVSSVSSAHQYQTTLGTVSIIRQSKALKSHRIINTRESETQQTTDIYVCSIRPSFLSWCLELCVMCTSLRSPEIRLRSVHVLDRLVENELRHSFFDNDLISLQRLLGDGSVSLDSIDKHGQPLLLLAQLYQYEETITYLVHQGCHVETNNIQLCSSKYSFDENTFRLLCSRSDLTECTIDTIFPDTTSIMNSTSMYEWYITQSLTSTCLLLPEWFGSKLYVEAQAWAKLIYKAINYHLIGPDLENNRNQCLYWENLILQSIKGGADLHYLDEDTCTTFGVWVQSYHPLDVEDIVERWLDILKHCNVDTVQYLQREIGLYKVFQSSAGWGKSFVRQRNIDLRQGMSQRLRIEISWEHSKFPNAGLVLGEFVGFGDDEGFSPLLRFSRITKREWKKFWPFSHTAAVYCEGQHAECTRCTRYKRREDVMLARRERIDESRVGSSVYFVEEQPVMPGAWVH
ncbi:hypothetical protein F5X99DRAFT_427949 [Biscogniauxia marginata]|nr:hypothetical protein F5X99DRAFT_427949 [Biscogniauxia marginata]